MIHEIRPELIYPDSRLFLDYVAGRDAACRLFRHRDPGSPALAGRVREVERPRDELSKALRDYNEHLGASVRTLANIDALRDAQTVCVVGGQQAGLLGGPLYTVYKTVSIVRLAAHLSSASGMRVVPVFWLATEDHDFTEINRAAFLEDDGSLRTYTFDWPERGRPVEALPITPEVSAVAQEIRDRFPIPSDAWSLFEPSSDDDYGRWHARIWSRLLGDDGLILVEPRAIRHLAAGFFRDVLARPQEIADALAAGANSVRTAGYEALLEPGQAGRLFRFDGDGRRVRVDPTVEPVDVDVLRPEGYSSDVALRPLFTDRLFPTVAHLLGPSEIAYHALLGPLYEVFGIPQPAPIPRAGYTLLSEEEDALLQRLGVSVEEAIRSDFDAMEALEQAASADLREAFSDARSAVRNSLRPLLPRLTDLDPGLEARWRQAADHASQGLDRLEDRARRADLARRGISAKQLQRLATSLRPANQPQERVLSFVYAASRYGVEWLKSLPGSDRPERFSHRAVTLQGET